jgi:hypothetical protein
MINTTNQSTGQDDGYFEKGILIVKVSVCITYFFITLGNPKKNNDFKNESAA